MSMTKDEKWLCGWLVAIVIIHYVVTLWHATAHTHIPVLLSSVQTAFVSIVIIVLPLIGAGMLWTKRKRGAALLITATMLASLLFGFLNHFVLESPDYVMEVPEHAWRHSFVFSAALLVVTETVGTVMGAITTHTWRRA
jgi:hypothetical protein